MRRTFKATIALIALTGLFSSCQASSSSASFSRFDSGVAYIMPNRGSIHMSDANGNTTQYQGTVGMVAAFNTSISMTYYLSGANQAQDTAFENDFSDSFDRYHALFDRHHNYIDDNLTTATKVINNIKTVNDSYASGTPVVLDEELFDSLYRSWQFSIDSKGKFNIAVGALSTVWDQQIEEAADYSSNDYAYQTYGSISYAQQRVIYDDPNPELISYCLALTPTAEELKTMLVFNKTDHSVLFNEVPRITAYLASEEGQTKHQLSKDAGFSISAPSITLGGYGKGEATELFTSKHQDRVFLINSGSSSIKCQGGKMDGSAWDITVSNPFFYEASRVASYSKLGLNYGDLIMSEKGSFNLSTSGFYQQYFYGVQSDGTYKLRDHILDASTGYSHTFFASCSVFLNDSGYADMYTTSLMNCDSVTEAAELIKYLDEKTGVTCQGFLFLTDSPYGEAKKVTAYASSDLYSQISDATVKFPDYFTNPSITTVFEVDSLGNLVYHS